MTLKRNPRKAMIEEVASLTRSREEVKSLLQKQVEAGNSLKVSIVIPMITSPEIGKSSYRKWNSINKGLLSGLFTTEKYIKIYENWHVEPKPGYPLLSQVITGLDSETVILKSKISQYIDCLESVIAEVEFMPIESDSSTTQSSTLSARTSLNKVFIVHGHDENSKMSLELFLHKIGLEPIVLHRQTDGGLTLIEKFEKYSDVGYAFILLTPDEISYLQSETPKDDKDRNKEFRARPNVIFEFGYFIGKLGRHKVCCLHTGNVTLPSDVSGMVYKRYENKIDEIGLEIVRELNAAGYDVKLT
jgi:predicted nucleotide-binding protein